MNKIERERLVFSDVDAWMKYIKSLPKPRNDIDRTHNHFLSINFFESKLNILIKNIISFPVLIVSLLGTMLRSLIRGCKFIKQYDMIQFTPSTKKRTSISEVGAPQELLDEFKKQLVFDQWGRRSLFFEGYLDLEALTFWLKSCRYPGSIYMNLSMLVHLAAINKLIHMYNPKCIATTETENDFNTSFLTAFCESKNILYVGIMHGENFVDPSHAFVRFSRFYVWDEFYIKQYVLTGSNADFFRIYDPNRTHLNIPNVKKRYYISYYLQGEDKTQLLALYNILNIFINKGLTCKIRMHPNATDRDMVFEIFGDSQINIETPEKISVENSYAESEYIVSKYSTVLTDAYYNDLKAAIDDLSDKSLYQNLEKVQYINLNRIELRLSDLVKEDIN